MSLNKSPDCKNSNPDNVKIIEIIRETESRLLKMLELGVQSGGEINNNEWDKIKNTK